MTTDTTTPSAPETPAPKATKNVLRIREIVALHVWVTNHTADCRTMPDTKLAALAQAELEFTVTAANIAGMRAELGIDKAKKEAPPSLEQQLGELRGFYELQQATVKLLEGRVKDLELHCFGEPPVKDHPELPLPTAPATEPVLDAE